MIRLSPKAGRYSIFVDAGDARVSPRRGDHVFADALPMKPQPLWSKRS
jgi:hypothetical protein